VAVKLVGLAGGVIFGFTLSWARLTDPAVIRDMLLVREAHVFLLMGTAIAVAAVGCRLLRLGATQSFFTREPIAWSVPRPEPRHVGGSVLFGAGWSIAGTCPGPVAAMVGEGKVIGLLVAVGILAGVTLQPLVFTRRTTTSRLPERSGAPGL
jgi:uncharacterized membrane protein YedE/YeeE